MRTLGRYSQTIWDAKRQVIIKLSEIALSTTYGLPTWFDAEGTPTNALRNYMEGLIADADGMDMVVNADEVMTCVTASRRTGLSPENIVPKVKVDLDKLSDYRDYL